MRARLYAGKDGLNYAPRRPPSPAAAAACVANREISKRNFSGSSVRPTAASACSMAKVKLGSKEFDLDSEVIHASCWRVSDADCVVFAARMKKGEICRVKRLILVRFIVFHLLY